MSPTLGGVHPEVVDVEELFDAQGQRLPTGLNRSQRWRYPLCSCSCAVCLCVFCCRFVPIGQLYEKIVKKGRCLQITLSLYVIGFVSSLFYGRHGYVLHIQKDPKLQQQSMVEPGPVEMGLHLMIGFMTMALGVTWIMAIRARLRAQYRIPEFYCSGMEDFCCAWCCGPCTLCQMMEHVYAYPSTGGTPCNVNPTGDPDGLDLNLFYMPANPRIDTVVVKVI